VTSVDGGPVPAESKEERRKRRRERTKLKRAAKKASLVSGGGDKSKKDRKKDRKSKHKSKSRKERRKSKAAALAESGASSADDAPPVLEVGPESAASSPPAVPVGITSGPDKRRLYKRHPSIAMIQVNDIPEEYKEEIEQLRRQLEANVLRKEAAQRAIDKKTDDLNNLIHNKKQIKKDTKKAIKLLKVYQLENEAILNETGEVKRQHEEAMEIAAVQDPVNRYLARSGWEQDNAHPLYDGVRLSTTTAKACNAFRGK